MIAKEAKNLLPGTVVMWDNDPDDLGTVRQVSSWGFSVDWANGERGWIDFRGAQMVSLFQPREEVVA